MPIPSDYFLEGRWGMRGPSPTPLLLWANVLPWGHSRNLWYLSVCSNLEDAAMPLSPTPRGSVPDPVYDRLWNPIVSGDGLRLGPADRGGAGDHPHARPGP